METIILFAPLVGALLAGLTWRAITDAGAQWVATGFAVFAAVLSWVVWINFDGTLQQTYLMDWLRSGTLDASFALRLDDVAVQMMVAITTVSALAHIYALGFMERDKSFDEGLSFRPRFFAYLSLFTFAMLLLVVSDGLLQILLGLQLASVMAYLLINFRTHYKNANAAAIKSFVITTLGHGALILGVAGLYLLTDSLQLDDIIAALPDLQGRSDLTLAMGLVLLGAMALSAQLLFHVWLPDAMEAPAPAAALLSAVFAVSGALVIWRLDPVFAETRIVQDAMAWIGVGTAILAGLWGMAQCDIKRACGILAMAQLGLIVAALGLGLGDGVHQIAQTQILLFVGVQVLLVLCTGAITRAMDDSRDMLGFGGLGAKLPIVAFGLVLAAAVATGFGFGQAVLGVLILGPGNMGFASAYLLHPALFWAFVLAAGLGIFALWREVFLCLIGPSRAPETVVEGIEPTPRVMGGVLVLLSGLMLGFVAWQGMRMAGFPGLAGPAWLVWAPFAAALAGFGLAAWCYILQPGLPKAAAQGAPALHRLLREGLYVDRAYGVMIVAPFKQLGALFGDRIDPTGFDAPMAGLAKRLTPKVNAIADRRFGVWLIGCAAAVFFGLMAAITWSVLAGGAV